MTDALRIEHLSKSFGGTRAVSDVSLTVSAGEILGLVGRNGAGKSTIIKILSGFHAPDPGGTITIWGHRAQFPIKNAQSYGMAIIQQDLALCENLTVLENLGVCSGYGVGTLGIRWRKELRRMQELLSEFGVDIDLWAPVSSLHPAERATVALMRAVRLIREVHGIPPLLVLDEPTVYMGPQDRDRLFGVVRNVAAAGGAAIFVSHRLAEVVEICDSIVVLRDGSLTASFKRGEVTTEGVVTALIGEQPTRTVMESEEAITPREGNAIEVEELTGRMADGLSFSVAPGEILGVTGLAGMGQDEIPYLISGTTRGSGSVRIGGHPIKRWPAGVARAGVAVVPANRLGEGIWRSGSARENLTVRHMWKFWHKGFLRRRAEQSMARDQMSRFDVRPLRSEQAIERFSGGNQQKIVVARALWSQPRVLIMHEPTQGVDVGTRTEIWQHIRTEARKGVGIILCSSDVDEVVAICSRVLVLRDGKTAGKLTGDQINERDLLIMMNASTRIAI